MATITDTAEALAEASQHEAPKNAEITKTSPKGRPKGKGKTPSKAPLAKPSTIPANRGLKKGQTKDTGRSSGAETKSNKTDRRPVLLAVAKKLVEVEGVIMDIAMEELEPAWASGHRKLKRIGLRLRKFANRLEGMGMASK